jgi:hypothetical protein
MGSCFGADAQLARQHAATEAKQKRDHLDFFIQGNTTSERFWMPKDFRVAKCELFYSGMNLAKQRSARLNDYPSNASEGTPGRRIAPSNQRKGSFCPRGVLR